MALAAILQKEEDRNAADHLLTCPRCADLCPPEATAFCPECGCALLPDAR